MRTLLLIGVLFLWGTMRAQESISEYNIQKEPTEEYKEAIASNLTCENCLEENPKVQKPFELTIFPNPCNGKCSLKIDGVSESEEAKLTIMDLTGKNVFTYLLTDGEVELKLTATALELHEGTYLVQLQKGDQFKTKRMIVK